MLFSLAAACAVGDDLFPRRPALVTAEAEKTIAKGLRRLDDLQNPDGSYGTGMYPCTMTSVAGLAFMAGGNTLHEGRYTSRVRRAVTYVLSCASPNGLIARLGEEGSRPMYAHGYAMLFLAQAYGTAPDTETQRAIRQVLDRAIRLTASAQSRDGGWNYTPDSGGDEGSVTITQVQGLRAARNAGIRVPVSTIRRARKYIENSANEDGGIAYRVRARGGSRPPITAAAVAVLYNAGEYDHPVALKAVKYLQNYLGESQRRGRGILGHGHDAYFLMYISQAMFLHGEETWQSFFPDVRNSLIKHQAEDGGWTGHLRQGGEAFSVASALLTLQMPYGYLPILQR